MVREFDVLPYQRAYDAMVEVVAAREAATDDQIWLLEHPAVYTQGTSCTEQTLAPTDIPIVKTDRGGQITYHGPGQLVMYPMLHLKRYGIGVKGLVANLEQAVINLLRELNIYGKRRQDAPGVYVAGAKIAALGLRIRRGISYHGLSLNLDMDLTPFANIDPCGYQGLQVTQIKDCVEPSVEIERPVIQQRLLHHFLALI